MLYIMIILPILGFVFDILYNNKLKSIYMIISLIEFYISILLYVFFNNNNIEMKDRSEYLGIDSINLPLILITTIIIPIILLIREKYNNEDIIYQRIILLIELGLIILFIVNDILLFYILFELILIPMFIIIIRYGSRYKKIEAAYKFIIYTIVGSLLFIISIIIISIIYNSTSNEIIEILLFEEKKDLKLII
jgi:NADH:ubiquinone oxidoreductase subunit 4 (subunit M)